MKRFLVQVTVTNLLLWAALIALFPDMSPERRVVGGVLLYLAMSVVSETDFEGPGR